MTVSDASVEGPLELVVLDCGLAGSLSQADRVNFVTLLEAIGRKRGRDAGGRVSFDSKERFRR